MISYIKEMIINPIVTNLIIYNGDLFKNLLIGLLIIFVGWVIGKVVQIILKFVLKIIRFDDFCDKTKITHVLENAGLYNIPSNTIANLFYWIIILLSFISAADLLIDVSSFQVLQQIISFMPSALLALFILIVGMAFGYFFSKIIKSIAISSGAHKSMTTLLEKILFVIIVIFSAKTALNILKINDKIILVIVDNFFKFSFVGIAIAFGLGTKNFAEDFLAYYKIKSAFPQGTEILIDNEKAIIKEIKLFHTLLYTENGIIDLPNAVLSRKIVKKFL